MDRLIYFLIAAAPFSVLAQSDGIAVGHPVRTLDLPALWASGDNENVRFERMVSWKDTFTFLISRGRNAKLIRTKNDGRISWQTPLQVVDDTLDLVVTPSGGVDVLLITDADGPDRLVHFGASGKQLSSESVGDVFAICMVGDRLFGLDESGYIERIGDHRIITKVSAPENSFQTSFVAVGAQTAAVVNKADGTLDIINVETGSVRSVVLDDEKVATIKENYRQEGAHGLAIMGAAGFDGGVFMMLSGFPPRQIPLLAVDLNGHTTATRWLSLKTGPFDMDIDGETVNILDWNDTVTAFRH
jgi:hypothetical protein